MRYQIEKFYYDSHKGVINKNQKQHILTQTQRKLLNFFIENPNRIYSKQNLMEQVWGRIVTENSVDQIISILRNYLEESPSKPNVIVTHYGKGFSFEASFHIIEPATSKGSKLKSKPVLLIVLALIVGVLFWFLQPTQTQSISSVQNTINNKNRKILILPNTFQDQSIGQIEQKGMMNSLKYAFNTLDSEGQMIFDETSFTTQQAIEKHWKLEEDLIVMRSNIIKNGEIYEAVIELSNGVNSKTQTKLTANSLNDLLNNQISFISQYNQQLRNGANNQPMPMSVSDKYIKALGYRRSGNLEKAKSLIQEVLQEKDDDHKARLVLAEILIEQKQFDESLAQLNTLKSTPAYKFLGTEIELNIAKINYLKHHYQQTITNLMAYQNKHTNIGEIKKAKIQIQLGQAYLSKGDSQNALKAFKTSIKNIQEQLNPDLFAKSFYGQGKVLMTSSVDKKVSELFLKSLEYAKLANNVYSQILALNELSLISLTSYDWENAIGYTKEGLSLSELNNDKHEIGKGLGNLVAILNLRGQFTEAKQVNERLGKIAKEVDSSSMQLHYLHYSAILAMNEFDWLLAQQLIDKQLKLAEETKNYGMQLNNAFIALELILLKKDTDSFMAEWHKRELLIKKLRFERYQIYMDYYLARYYIQTFELEKAEELILQVSEKALQTKDFKIFVDAQNRLAEVYLTADAKKALQVLNDMEQYNPHANPYLDLKAKALYKLGKNIEALTVLNQAKIVYHESWTAENQALLEVIQKVSE